MKCIKYVAIIIAFSVGCNTINVFEKSKPFSNHQWVNNDSCVFSFDVTDTTSLYNYYFILRHEEKYLYSNIWLSLTVQQPDTTVSFNREFALANNKKWLGTRMDDITEHRLLFNQQAIPLKKGKYVFTIKQIMRDNPLPYVLSAGIRIQKKQ